jgi:hypothetical protein
MSAMPSPVSDHSQDLGDLLDSFIAYRRYRPPQARMLRRTGELPWVFRGYVRRRDANSAWRAWAQGARTSFLVAGIAQAEWNDRGAPVLDVRFFDAEGQPFPRSLWRQRADGSWLECIRP